MNPRTAFFGMAVLGIGGLLLILNHNGALVQGISNDAFAGVVAGLAMLILVGGAALGEGGLRTVVINATIWGMVFLGVITAYIFRDDVGNIVNRYVEEFDPSAPKVGEDGESVSIGRDIRGHFSAKGSVNGQLITFLIDTGATRVTLSAEDARTAGIDPAGLSYTARVFTGNGESMVAPVRIGQMSIGTIVLNDVRAFVAQDGAMRGSLLGMSFLGRLPGYTVRGDQMTLLGPGD